MKPYISAKAFIWSLDVIVAIVIFLVALTLFYQYSINLTGAQQKDLDSLLLNGKLISSYLTSQGYPTDWQNNPGGVTLIGITGGNMDINPDKVYEFSQLADSPSEYEDTRKLLSTTNDYYVFFQDKNNNTVKIRNSQGFTVDGIGKDYTTDAPEDIIRIIRFVNYNSTIIRMVLYVW